MTLSPDNEAFVRESRVARFATADEQGRPHVVPVCFVYHDGCVYSLLDAKPKRVPPHQLRRVRNLLARPEVQLLIDRYEEDWSRLAYVQLRGVASLLDSGREHAEALALLRTKYFQYADAALDAQPIIKIAVRAAMVWGPGLAQS